MNSFHTAPAIANRVIGSGACDLPVAAFEFVAHNEGAGELSASG